MRLDYAISHNGMSKSHLSTGLFISGKLSCTIYLYQLFKNPAYQKQITWKNGERLRHWLLKIQALTRFLPVKAWPPACSIKKDMGKTSYRTLYFNICIQLEFDNAPVEDWTRLSKGNEKRKKNDHMSMTGTNVLFQEVNRWSAIELKEFSTWACPWDSSCHQGT